MLFSKGKLKYDKFDFLYSGCKIDIVDQYKYLGIIFFFNGNLKHAAEDLYLNLAKLYSH